MDAFQKLWRFIEPRLRIVMFLLFIVMLVGVFALYNMEAPEDESGGAMRPAGRAADLPDDRRPADLIKGQIYADPKPMEETEFAPLIANSMFSVKSVKDQTERESEANRKYEQAVEALNASRFEDALRLVNEVLAIKDNHAPARGLKQRLEARLNR